MNTADIDTTNMCSHLRHKLMDNDGIYHHLWQQINNDQELTAVVALLHRPFRRKRIIGHTLMWTQ